MGNKDSILKATLSPNIYNSTIKYLLDKDILLSYLAVEQILLGQSFRHIFLISLFQQ